MLKIKQCPIAPWSSLAHYPFPYPISRAVLFVSHRLRCFQSKNAMKHDFLLLFCFVVFSTFPRMLPMFSHLYASLLCMAAFEMRNTRTHAFVFLQTRRFEPPFSSHVRTRGRQSPPAVCMTPEGLCMQPDYCNVLNISQPT